MSHRNVIDPIYLACFCEDDNLLSQWRAYGQSGGYSLGFKVPGDPFTGQGFSPEPNTFTSTWVKVEYNRTKQAEKCLSILNPTLTMFDDSETSKAVAGISDHPLVGCGRVLRVISDILLEEIVGFKNEAFAVEKEWRVVVRQRELIKQGTDDGGKTLSPIHFRSSDGSLVPYVKLIPSGLTKLPIVCVRCGPTLDKITASMAVSMLLQKNGFPVRVQGSDIPVRFKQC